MDPFVTAMGFHSSRSAVEQGSVFVVGARSASDVEERIRIGAIARRPKQRKRVCELSADEIARLHRSAADYVRHAPPYRDAGVR
jgi:hypothetical protein